MNYYGAVLIIITLIAAMAYGLYRFSQYRRSRRLQQIDSLPFPDEYARILYSLPHYSRLDNSDRETLHRSVLRFVHTKEFIGIGIDVNNEMRLIIAFYACLLLLRKNAPEPYPNTRTILIYPDSVVIEQQRNDGGIVTDESVEIDGQSADGTVVITWDAAYDEAVTQGDANLILHEFTHEIDFMDGSIDGIPPMEASKVSRWTEVLDGEFDALYTLVRNNKELGEYALFGEDAALDEAEFFAVATERFFGVPGELATRFPELYEELRGFYGLDTALLFQAAKENVTEA
jgi:hypothetical protein